MDALSPYTFPEKKVAGKTLFLGFLACRIKCATEETEGVAIRTALTEHGIVNLRFGSWQN